MNAHAAKWLDGYIDGEIHGARLHKIEEHLKSCTMCQFELEQIRKLSILLEECPPATTRTSREQFAAQVGLRMPRTKSIQSRTTWQEAVSLGWLAIPVSIILVWALSQTILLIINGIQGMGVALPWTTSISSFDSWVGSIDLSRIFGSGVWNAASDAVAWLDIGERLVYVFAPYLTITIVTAVFLWCWMVCWWVLHQRHQQQFNHTVKKAV